ncbi:MAG TPA: DUF3618 domain-containing protein [Candidatus Limnocylindrales bacterium]|nr:DUF3618 domain-containing protein [Candidatus Limnocylindrales bacterium]
MAQASVTQPASAPARKPADIEADLDATRERLVGTITELEDRVNPSKVAKRGSNKVKDFYVGSDGVRWKNVALTAGAVVGGLIAVRMASRTVRWAIAAPPAQQVPTDIVFLPVPRAQAGALAELAAAV